MAILDIKKAGDVVLKQQAQPVARIDKKIRTFARRYGRNDV